MDIDVLVERLAAAQSPDRALDTDIARVVGWKRTVETYIDDKSGERRNRTLWLVPNGKDVAKVPAYTGRFEDALHLVSILAPGCVGACRWDNGRGWATIGETGRLVEASSPIIALCIAALLSKPIQ